VLSTNAKGAIAETKIAAAATELGVSVLRPIVEHGRYDLGFEIDNRFFRVQCKWGALDEEAGVVKVNLSPAVTRLAWATSTRNTAPTRSTWLRPTVEGCGGATFYPSQRLLACAGSTSGCHRPRTGSVRALILRRTTSSLGL
jgi:hypothetical protein